MEAQAIIKEVLTSIEPTREEVLEIDAKVKRFTMQLSKLTKGEVYVGGYYAKGIWIKGIKDVDVFVRYAKEDGLADRLEKELKKGFAKVTRLHGSRDYFRTSYEGLLFERIYS